MMAKLKGVIHHAKKVVVGLALVTVGVHVYWPEAALSLAVLYAVQTVLSELEDA